MGDKQPSRNPDTGEILGGAKVFNHEDQQIYSHSKFALLLQIKIIETHQLQPIPRNQLVSRIAEQGHSKFVRAARS